MASSLGKVELRTLGNTGLKLSCVGFGASPLGNVFGPVSEDDAIASVRLAFSLGINFFDTSPYYGGTLSEKVLGKTLKALNVPRNEYIVSTKCGRYAEGFDFSAERVTNSIDESLARLQLDYVDILQCHDIEFGNLDQIVNETIPALQKLKEAGKIRFIGITGLPLEVFTYVLDRVPPGTVDVILSYCHYSVNDSTLDDLIPYLKSKGVGVISCTLLDPFHTWCRSMSTPRGRSMRSKVEQRMKKESGKTLREVRRAKKIQKKLMTESERHVYNLKRAKRKVALLLQKLKKYELPDLPPPRHDPELFTPEQLQAFKKIGFKNKNYVPVGVRGVFGGVVQNMHLHWKFHETVQVCCDNFPKERIKEMATMLARLSGGIVINIHNVKTIIMFRGRNYRQPKNLIPINTLTKRKALFKARFEQALESQKLNIKKIEQQLRRSGINPEDPVATASIQRVASSFFNAIDKKEGTPYVFQEDKLSLEDSNNFESSEPSDEKEQEELDKFIAEIEDAAEREWAAEEAAEKEDFGRLKYWNREEFGGRFRRAETFRGDSSYDENRGDRNWKDTRGKHRTSESDDEDDDASDADDKWQSRNSRGASPTPVDSDIDESDESEESFKPHRGDGRRQERISRPRNNEGYKRNAPMNFRKSMPEEDSDEENVLSDLETAMQQSDADEKHGSSTARATNYNYRSDSDEEENSYNRKEEKGRRLTYRRSSDDSDECNRLEAPRVVKGTRRMTYESSADDSDECNRLEAPKVAKGRRRMNYESSDDDSDECNRLEAPKVVKGRGITYETSADDSDENGSRFKVPRAVKGRQNRAGGTGNNEDPRTSTIAASSHSEIAWLEEDDTEALGGGKLDYWSSGDEEEYQVKSDYKEKTDTRKSKSAKEMDETWDSD